MKYIYMIKGKQVTPGKALDFRLSAKMMFKPLLPETEPVLFMADEYDLSQKWLEQAKANVKSFEELNAPECLKREAQKRVSEWQFRALVAEPYQRSRQSVLQ